MMQFLRNRDFRPLLVVCALLAIVWLRHHPRRTAGGSREQAVSVAQVRDLFPEAATLAPGAADSPSWRVLDADGMPLGTVVVSGLDTMRVTGYAGPTPVAIGLDEDGDVFGVLLLANSESEGYLQDAIDSGLLESWNGLPVAEALQKHVDAVSGATMSSSSIIETVRLTLQPLARNREKAAAPSSITVATVAIWLVLLLDVVCFVMHRKWRRLRTVALVLNVVVFGFFAGTMLSLAQIKGWALHGIPARIWLTSGAMLVLAVVLPLFTRRDFYCATVCPFGSLQELLGRLRRPSARMPKGIGGLLRTLRGCVLGTAWLVLIAGATTDFTRVEPFAAFQFRMASVNVLVLAVMFLVLSLFVPRVWCRYLCPTGRLLSTTHCVPDTGTGRRALFGFWTTVVLLLVLGASWLAWNLAYVPAEQPKDVLGVIHARKSVRHYTDEPVTKAQLDTLLRAGMAAPTAGNAQPWSFVVVTDRNQLRELASGLEYGKMLAKAGAAIVVCGMPDEALPGKANGMWVLDCSVASENILLAAEGTGLGAVWVGVYPLKERIEHVRKVLGLPETVVPLNVISLGHPAGIERPKRKYNESRIHWDSWESK
jgi:nitroreductase